MPGTERILWLVGAASDRWPFEPLKRLYPDLVITPVGAAVPLTGRAPEEVLAACCAAGLRVRGSRVTAAPPAS